MTLVILVDTVQWIAKNYPSDGLAADEKCAKLYKLPANYGSELRAPPHSRVVCVSIIIIFLIGILTDPPPT